MTKLIAILVVVAVLIGGWQLFLYWERVQNEKETEQKQASTAVVPEQLPGLPYQLEQSLHAAQNNMATMKTWLKTYGATVQDPRKAWIELDYCLLITRDNPAEARRIFAAVRDRTPSSSPVWPRIQKLAKTYE